MLLREQQPLDVLCRATEVPTHHGSPDVGQSALGFIFSKLQTADVLQTGPVLVHLLIDDQLHTPTGWRSALNPTCEQG